MTLLRGNSKSAEKGGTSMPNPNFRSRDEYVETVNGLRHPVELLQDQVYEDDLDRDRADHYYDGPETPFPLKRGWRVCQNCGSQRLGSPCGLCGSDR